VALLERVTIQNYRGARDLSLEPGALCALAGESSSGKSTVLAAVWMLLEAAAPPPGSRDVARTGASIRVTATTRGREIFLDARPPATLNLNREGAPPALFFPAGLRSGALVAPTDHADALPRPAGGGLSLVRAIRTLLENGARGLVVLIEEPELFLGPPAQRNLHGLLRALAARGRNQVLYSTHSPVFLDVERLEELVLVHHHERTGLALRRPAALGHRQSLRMVSELGADRAEIFLARAALLVEGRTEKIALPFVFAALGYDADEEAIAVIDCAGKGNIPLLAEICNACGIPYVVLHDRDAPRGVRPPTAERIANAAIRRAAGRRRTVMLVPDFEAVSGLRARRGKPAAALRRFRGGNDAVPEPLRAAVERVVAAARRAQRTTSRA
jgi:putative ATP-dependent endonuclease of the OLD family